MRAQLRSARDTSVVAGPAESDAETLGCLAAAQPTDTLPHRWLGGASVGVLARVPGRTAGGGVGGHGRVLTRAVFGARSTTVLVARRSGRTRLLDRGGSARHG